MKSGKQTEYHEIKESEVQTDFTDTTTSTGVTVKWGEKDTLTLPPGTVVLRYEPGSYEETKVKELPLDYPVMSSPASLVFHPVLGVYYNGLKFKYQLLSGTGQFSYKILTKNSKTPMVNLIKKP